jgi:hypothetical protein
MDWKDTLSAEPVRREYADGTRQALLTGNLNESQEQDHLQNHPQDHPEPLLM